MDESVQNLAAPECTSLAWSADGQMLYLLVAQMVLYECCLRDPIESQPIITVLVA